MAFLHRRVGLDETRSYDEGNQRMSWFFKTLESLGYGS